MNGVTYRVWKILLENPRQWMSAQDIAHDSNLTRLQAQSSLKTMPSPPIIKERDGSGAMRYMLDADGEELTRIHYDIIRDRYDISDELQARILEYMDSKGGGWATLKEIRAAVGETQTRVYYAMSVIPEIQKTRCNRVYIYRKVN